MFRRRPILLAALALAAPLPALAASEGGLTPVPGPVALSVSTSLGSCGVLESEIVCELSVSYNTLEAASSYSATVTRPDGSVVDYGDVGAGGATIWVPYVGSGNYSVRITAYGTPPEPEGEPEVIATDVSTSPEAEAGRDGEPEATTETIEPEAAPRGDAAGARRRRPRRQRRGRAQLRDHRARAGRPRARAAARGAAGRHRSRGPRRGRRRDRGRGRARRLRRRGRRAGGRRGRRRGARSGRLLSAPSPPTTATITPMATATADQLSDAARGFVDSAPLALLIGGERPAAADGRTFESIDPATGEPICAVAHAGAEDVERAVGAARAALDGPLRKVSPVEARRASSTRSRS